MAIRPLLAGAFCALASFTSFAITAPAAENSASSIAADTITPAKSESSAAAKPQETKIDRIPKIHGVLRARYEGEWGDRTDGEEDIEKEYLQRFQVRNARLSVEGKILAQLDYYFRIDICDRGKMKFLDAWARWKFNPRWAVKAGQFRVPFGVDAFRGPGTYIFANRSFIGKNMANVRQVGVQGGYYGSKVPLTVEAGVFNSAPMSDHEVWQRDLDYAVKGTYQMGNVSVSASFLSMKPYGIRMNIVDGAVVYSWRNLRVEGEYQNLHYVGGGFPNVNAWLVYASYGIPVNWNPFQIWNFHARFDAMTDHSTGKPDADTGYPLLTDLSRRRITAGTSICCAVGKLKGEIILDYEKYFYNNGVIAPVGASDKIVAELVVKF